MPFNSDSGCVPRPAPRRHSPSPARRRSPNRPLPRRSVLDVALFLAAILLGFALVLAARSIALVVLLPAVDLGRAGLLLGALVRLAPVLALLPLLRGQGGRRQRKEAG